MPRSFFASLALLAGTIAAFWGVGSLGFVAYDDPAYVVSNPMVNQGLRSAAFLWAWTDFHGGNWHPLTSLSHMLDCTLFGVNARAHHLVNLGWHGLNVALVWCLWRRMEKMSPIASASCAGLVAGFFAVHPLHVESVAWISARKDLVSTAMWLGTLFAYFRFTERPTLARYGIVVTGTALALMAKPIAVTLPFTLLLLDGWPLGRWRGRAWPRLILEKFPLFSMAVAMGVVTMIAQRSAGATEFGATLSLDARMGNAAVTCVRYLIKTVYPDPLAPFYPHPGEWPWWALIGSTVALAIMCIFVWKQRNQRPWLAWGWAWYLITLAPTLGLVQVGAQAMADRYTYVPLLGIFTILVGIGAETVARWPRARIPLAVAAALLLVLCAAKTARQVPVWKDGIRLAGQIAAVAPGHPIAYREMGSALAFAGRARTEVEDQYRRGLAAGPEHGFFLNELGLMAAQGGRYDEALSYLQRLRDLQPRAPAAWTNLASVQTMAGQLDAAIDTTRRALAIDSTYADARRVLAQIYVRQGRLSDARAELEQAVRDDRWSWVLHNELGVVLIGLGRIPEGVSALERAIWIHPGDEAARNNLALARQRRVDETAPTPPQSVR